MHGKYGENHISGCIKNILNKSQGCFPWGVDFKIPENSNDMFLMWQSTYLLFYVTKVNTHSYNILLRCDGAKKMSTCAIKEGESYFF